VNRRGASPFAVIVGSRASRRESAAADVSMRRSFDEALPMSSAPGRTRFLALRGYLPTARGWNFWFSRQMNSSKSVSTRRCWLMVTVHGAV
jgi:hypothetical protein